MEQSKISVKNSYTHTHTHININIECERPSRFEFLFIKGDIGKGISSNFVHSSFISRDIRYRRKQKKITFKEV